MWKFLLIMIVPFVFSCGQDLSRFVLIRNDGARIEGRDGRINGLTFDGTDLNGNILSVRKDSIKTLYRSTGSKTMLLGALGFVAGAAIALGVSYNQYDRQYQPSLAGVLACAGAGALIGALAGSTSRSWEIVPLDNRPSRASDLMNRNTFIQLSINL
ncbi:MAG: hypothetical protein ACM3U0_02135 [archaeon]